MSAQELRADMMYFMKNAISSITNDFYGDYKLTGIIHLHEDNDLLVI